MSAGAQQLNTICGPVSIGYLRCISEGRSVEAERYGWTRFLEVQEVNARPQRLNGCPTVGMSAYVSLSD
jgi:hypothetical protein